MAAAALAEIGAGRETTIGVGLYNFQGLCRGITPVAAGYFYLYYLLGEDKGNQHGKTMVVSGQSQTAGDNLIYGYSCHKRVSNLDMRTPLLMLKLEKWPQLMSGVLQEVHLAGLSDSVA